MKQSIKNNKAKIISINYETIQNADINFIQSHILELIEKVANNEIEVPEKRIKKITINVDDDIYHKFKRIIKEKGWNVSEFIQQSFS